MRAHAAFLAFVLTVAVGLPAFGQNITLATVDRTGPGHSQSGFELSISRSDCESTESFTFPFAIPDPSGVDAVEVWLADKSSIDCKSVEARSGGDCSYLANADVAGAGDILIPSADIANAVSSVDDCIDAAFGSAHHVALFFLLVRAPGEDIPNEDAAIFETDVDLVGPAPPTDLVAESAPASVKLQFTGSETDDLRGYFVFCAPPDNAAAGAGCESSVLQPGFPPPGPELRCAPTAGEEPLSATSALTVKDLANGERVAMAIAAVDALGNAGVLSNVVCGEPLPVGPQDQGEDGGDSCSAAPQGPGAQGSIALGALVLAAAAALARARASARSRARAAAHYAAAHRAAVRRARLS